MLVRMRSRALFCSQWLPGAVCSCLWHLRPFLLYQSKNNYGGGDITWLMVLFQGILPNILADFYQKKLFIQGWLKKQSYDQKTYRYRAESYCSPIKEISILFSRLYYFIDLTITIIICINKINYQSILTCIERALTNYSLAI